MDKNIDSSNLEEILINGLSGDQGFRILGATSGGTAGHSVGLAGDVNGYGIPDFMVGAYGIRVAYVVINELVCPGNCLNCEKFPVCLGCEAGYGLYEDQCLDECLDGMELENGICVVIIIEEEEEEEECPDEMELLNGICVPIKSSLETAAEVSKGLFDSGSVASRVFTMGRSLSVGLALMAKMIQNVRYLNVSYPQETLSAFESYGTDLFELPIPEMFYESPEMKDLPSQYSRYDIDPSFVENYWGTIMMILISLACFFVVRLIKYFTKNQGKESMLQVALKNIGQTAANFTVIQIYSSLDDVIFFFLLDVGSTKMSSFSAGLSLGVGSVFLLFGLALVCIHCWVLGKYQKAKEQDQLERFQEKFGVLGTLYEDFKDDNATKQSFFGILILRCVFLVLVIMLLRPAWIQASLLILANLIFLGYFIYQRPFKSLFDEISQYFCEFAVFAAYLSVLVLSVLDYKEDFTASERNGFGKCIVIAGIVLSLGGFLIQMIQIIGALYGIYQFFKEYTKKEGRKGEHGQKISPQDSQIELNRNLTIPEVTEPSHRFRNESDISFMAPSDNTQILNKPQRRSKIKKTREKKKDPSVIEARKIKVTSKPLEEEVNEMSQMEEGSLRKRKKLKIKPKFSDIEKE